MDCEFNGLLVLGFVELRPIPNGSQLTESTGANFRPSLASFRPRVPVISLAIYLTRALLVASLDKSLFRKHVRVPCML